MQIVANKWTANEKADAAREIKELTASFLAGFYRVGGPSGSGYPALAPESIKGDGQMDGLLFGWLLSRTQAFSSCSTCGVN